MNLPSATSSSTGKQAMLPAVRSSWRRYIVLLRVPLIAILLGLLMLALLQRRLIYHPRRGPVSIAEIDAPVSAGQIEAVRFTSADDIELHGWLSYANRRLGNVSDAVELRASLGEGDAPLVLYFQGNAANRARRARQFLMLNQLGCDVLIVDYRGYAENEGSPSEKGLLADARSQWEFAVNELGVSPERIVLFGESLGGGVATALAGSLCEQGKAPGGLTIRASFSSLVDAGAYHFPWIPVRWLMLDRFESADHITNVTCPILIMHGDRDEVIPHIQGEHLFSAAPSHSSGGIAKRFVTLNDCGHNDIIYVAGEQVRDALATFLSEAYPTSQID